PILSIVPTLDGGSLLDSSSSLVRTLSPRSPLRLRSTALGCWPRSWSSAHFSASHLKWKLRVAGPGSALPRRSEHRICALRPDASKLQERKSLRWPRSCNTQRSRSRSEKSVSIIQCIAGNKYGACNGENGGCLAAQTKDAGTAECIFRRRVRRPDHGPGIGA